MNIYRAALAPDGKPIARVILRPHPAIVRWRAANGLSSTTVAGSFLVDTGADYTIVAQHLARAAAMTGPIRRQRVGGIGGQQEAHVFRLECGLLLLNEKGKPGVQFWRGDVLALDRSMIFNLDGLLGRDFLSCGSLLFDGQGGFFQVALP